VRRVFSIEYVGFLQTHYKVRILVYSYVPFVVITILSFPQSWLTHGLLTRVPQVKQILLLNAELKKLIKWLIIGCLTSSGKIVYAYSRRQQVHKHREILEKIDRWNKRDNVVWLQLRMYDEFDRDVIYLWRLQYVYSCRNLHAVRIINHLTTTHLLLGLHPISYLVSTCHLCWLNPGTVAHTHWNKKNIDWFIYCV
jgi:hypothetical protein